MTVKEIVALLEGLDPKVEVSVVTDNGRGLEKFKLVGVYSEVVGEITLQGTKSVSRKEIKKWQ